jgi:hypothetical protein
MHTPASLEEQLVAALQAGDAEEARRLARLLHERGFNATAIQGALAAHRHLEEQLYAVLQEVLPLSRRAAKRRAIRAAEERDWGNWREGKRKV